MLIVVVTGLAGAGKSTVLRALEDVSFYCVDNVPLPLLPELTKKLAPDHKKLAVCIDSRQNTYLSEYSVVLQKLSSAGHGVEILYLEAADDVLIRRYSETRRQHPMSGDDVRQGIQNDRKALSGLRDGAAVVDTGALTVHQLKGIIAERYEARDKNLRVTLLSFGFKHGIPLEADLVFDVRFLPNPYFDPNLTGRDGRDDEVCRFVLGGQVGADTLSHIGVFLGFSLPEYAREGKRYLTVGVGCTGGRHRSVAIVEQLYRQFGGDWDMRVRHRDLDRSK